MRTIKILLFLVLAAAALLPAVAPAADKVDLLLVLAADVSRSIDNAKFQLQREGYAAAVSNPRVLDAVTLGPQRPHRRRPTSNGRASARSGC